MKLDDILDDEVALRNLKGKDLHVIGTCKECKHWKMISRKVEGAPSCKYLEEYKMPALPDFGCIHWTEKE